MHPVATFNYLMLIRENTSYVPHRFSPFTTVLFGVLVGIMYYATIKGISQAKQEQNILLIELRTPNLSSLILNLVLLQQMVLGCIGLPTELIKTINMAFGISCDMSMFMIAVFMLIYGRRKLD